MFDLENSINEWRLTLDSEALRASDIDELEAHLRESVVRLQNGDLSERGAFLVALDRLGDSQSIQSEFAKANPERHWRQRAIWMLAGFVAFRLAAIVISLANTLSSTALVLFGQEAWVIALASVAVTGCGWALFLLTGSSMLKMILSQRVKIGVAAGVMLGIAFVAEVILRMSSNVLKTRFMEIQEFGQIQLWQTYGLWVVNLAVFVTCVGILCYWTQSSKPHSTRAI